jgi:hypothetical protein
MIITSGISFNKNGEINFIFDFDANKSNDIIELAEIKLKKSKIHNHVYFYGYEFCNNVPINIRKEFNKQMKSLSETKLDPYDLEQFLTEPIRLLDRELDQIECIIYPDSNRTNINEMLVDYLFRFAPTRNFITLQAYMKEATDIKFDREMFDSNTQKLSAGQYKKLLSLAEDTIAKIKGLKGYFSISEIVPASLRKYVSNFLYFSDRMDKIIKATKNKDILIVDDINTSLSTIAELLRVIISVSRPKSIVIFTILGKDYKTIINPGRRAS